MYKAKDFSKQLVQIYEEIKQEYNNIVKETSKTDLMIQDMLHNIEFNTFNASQGYKLAKQIKDIRVERRKYKEELEAMLSLYNFIRPISKNLYEINVAITKLESHQKTRIYTPRILK